MVKRLEQVAALVVAAGLAIVSYWLFFSWAQGGRELRQPAPQGQGQSNQAEPSAATQRQGLR